MVQGTMRSWLRLEGCAALVLALALYAHDVGRWWLFAACFLIPDLSFAAYWLGKRVGAYAYNAVHSYVAPVLLLALALIGKLHETWALPVALIWVAHIGWDRMLGYGLKTTRSFDETHLGPIGKLRKEIEAGGTA